MTEELINIVVAAVAALCGVVAGRVFAVEGQNRLTALFAATYVGAGVGLLSSMPLGSLLTVVAKLMRSETEISTLLDTLDATGTAVLYGIACGAGGGLAIGLLVVGSRTMRRDRDTRVRGAGAAP